MSTRTLTGYFSSTVDAPPLAARVDIELAGVPHIAYATLTVGAGIDAATGLWSQVVPDTVTSGRLVRVVETSYGAFQSAKDYTIPVGSPDGQTLDISGLSPVVPIGQLTTYLTNENHRTSTVSAFYGHPNATTTTAGFLSAADKVRLDAAAVLGSATPQPLGTTAAGTSGNGSHADHVHAMPTASDVGAAASSHGHGQADVTGLVAALAAKSDTSHSHTVDGLSDVTAPTPSSGQVLSWNGSAWVNTTPTSGGATDLDGLSDVTITTPGSGQFLKHNGSAWVNVTPGPSDVGASASGHTHALDDLTDVTLTSPSNTQVLTYNGSAWVNAAPSGGGATDLDSLTDVTITTPASGQWLKYNGSTWVNTTPTAADVALAYYDVSGMVAGKPTASAILLRMIAVRAFTVPSGGTLSKGVAGTAATATTTFDMKKNGSSFGSFAFAASGTSATYTVASSTSFSAGDILTVVAPGSQDATCADVAFTIAGTI